MYYINKIVVAVLNPLGVGLLLMVFAWITSRHLRSSKFSKLFFLFAFAWLWFWSSGVAGRLVGLPLEREFPPSQAEVMPEADAIVVLGGGVGLATNVSSYAKLWMSADRVWHAARLYKAGKASKIFVTSEADALFMIDLGVPRASITIGYTPRNTEEEARFVEKSLGGLEGSKPRILLVTSAWHMRRAKLLYERYAKSVEVIPAATDYVCMSCFRDPLSFRDFLPDPEMLGRNAYMAKEWIGYFGYRWLR